MELDPWQKTILESDTDIVVRSGRQVGKSTIIAKKAADYALKNSEKTILIIASVERQAYLLFEKVLNEIWEHNYKSICKGKDRPTKHKIQLTNGSTIYCLPTGMSGYGIRGYTVDLLIADEAAFIPEAVWTAVTPMLSVTGGKKILISTPFGKGGYFYDCFNDDNYTKFHISSEDCKRIPKEFLERERKRMTKLQFAQEYLGEFVDELRQYFPTELIQKICILQTAPTISGNTFLGVDVARQGGDESVLVSLDRKDKSLNQIDLEVSANSYLTDTARLIKKLDSNRNFKKIYIDDGGMGVGVFDYLLEEEQVKRKIVAINNASRSLDVKETPQRKRLMKEDLYSNLLGLMERGEIQLYDNEELKQSLKSVQYEYSEDGTIKIFGNYTHITEAIIRAAWCVKDKSLNIWIDFNKR
jgi:hypothetical protein